MERNVAGKTWGISCLLDDVAYKKRDEAYTQRDVAYLQHGVAGLAGGIAGWQVGVAGGRGVENPKRAFDCLSCEEGEDGEVLGLAPV